MIVDTSAVVAILLDEPAAPPLYDAVLDHTEGRPRLSAPTYVELGVVVDGRRDPALSRNLDEVLLRLEAEVVPFDAEQARVARQAYRDYGKGSGHPARLNLGDCFSYALASVRREPLLYVGDDFTHTDVRSVL